MTLTLLISLAAELALGAERPDWAFPVADKVQPPSKDDNQPKTIPASAASYTQRQIDDLTKPPDWFPDMHPPMPEVVARGANTFACASCHLPTGTGHDESAYLAGLPAPYIVEQMADFKAGTRKGFGDMPSIARGLGGSEIQAAAAYFASLRAQLWVRVAETDTIPKTYVNRSSNMRLALPGAGAEPIGNRIVELPENEQAAVERDPRSGFVVYAPIGSIAKGEALVTKGGGKTTPCGVCHGPALKGTAIAPPIAGHHGNYVIRQLYFFSGRRARWRHGVVDAARRPEARSQRHGGDRRLPGIARTIARRRK